MATLEPIGYDRDDWATAHTAGVPLEQLQFTQPQTEEEMLAAITGGAIG